MGENSKIRVHMYSFGKEIKTRNFNKVFTVYRKNGKLGIDWNTSENDTFLPFSGFTSNIIFENVDNGKKYHFDSVKNDVVEF
jgi:hypothetical protein